MPRQRGRNTGEAGPLPSFLPSSSPSPRPRAKLFQAAGTGLAMSTKRQGKKKGQPRRTVPTATGAGAEGPVQDEAAVMPLQEQYERICQDLEHLRRQRGQLQAQHHFLQQEGQELHAQSQAFLGYLGKRARWRQGLAVSLSEENQALLGETRQQHQERLACMKEQEEALHKQLLQREAELAHLTSELEGLRWVQDLQKEQARHIQLLQQELATARKQQLEHLQAAKARFLREKAAHEQEAQRRAGLWVQEAQGAASRCLQEHSQAVQQQNQELRQELYRLVQRVQKLQAYKHHLQQKVQHLQQEHGCLQDLIPLHSRVGRWMVGP